MTGGGGQNSFDFTFGQGGNTTITDFNSNDTVVLSGFGISTVPTTTSGSSTIISLSDGTKITFLNDTAISSSQIVLK